MFESKNITYYLFAFSLIVIANYVATHLKEQFVKESDNSNEMINKYLLNTNNFGNKYEDTPQKVTTTTQMPSNQVTDTFFNTKPSPPTDHLKKHVTKDKPKIWIHTKHDINARKWKDFMSRNTYDLNMPYVHFTIQSIIQHNNDDFYIYLIDDETFSKLIPEWDADIFNMAEPMKSYFREIALMKIIHNYGGMIVPDSFLCTKSLLPFYNENLANKKPFVCENINRSCNLFEQQKKLLFVPHVFFMGCLKDDHTIGALIDNLRAKLTYQFDLTDERNFMGHTSQMCIRAIDADKMNLVLGQKIGVKTTKRKPILIEELFEERPLDLDDSHVGIYIPEDELLRRHKFNWFVYLSKEDVFKANSIIVKYMKKSLSQFNDEYSKKTVIHNILAL